MSQSSRVRLYYNSGMCKHTHPWAHVEKCTRISSVHEHLRKEGLLSQLHVMPGHSASDAELLLTHSKMHIEEIRRLSLAAKNDPTNRSLREPDGPGGVYYSADADSSARLAAGCVIEAAVGVLKDCKNGKRGPPAFALVRPPGHHAGADDTCGHCAEGFCFFNSVAVAANVVLASGAAKKVAILDWDVHHGNGTQSRFYDDERVFYISLHRYGERWYPETGDAEDAGEGKGMGHTLNVPWPQDSMGDSDYLSALKLVVLPTLKAYAPDLLLISAGFDAADGDPQGRMRVTPEGFGCMTAQLLAAVPCPVAVALEGGYNHMVTSQCCASVLRALMAHEGAGAEPPPTLLTPATERTLRKVIGVHKAHWPCLRYKPSTLDTFFAEAARVGAAMRASKRKHVAPAFADEEEAKVAQRKTAHSEAARMRREKEAAKKATSAEKADAAKRAAAAVGAAERQAAAARKRLREAEEEVQKAEKALEAAKRHATKSAEEAAAADGEDDADDEDDEESEDDTNGIAVPRHTVLWSAKVKCEEGRRVFAQYGDDDDELWFRATVKGVHRSEIGQYVDVEYDDGDTETMKPIKRVQAIDFSSSDEEGSDEEED